MLNILFLALMSSELPMAIAMIGAPLRYMLMVAVAPIAALIRTLFAVTLTTICVTVEWVDICKRSIATRLQWRVLKSIGKILNNIVGASNANGRLPIDIFLFSDQLHQRMHDFSPHLLPVTPSLC